MKDYKVEALRFLNIAGICYKSDFIKMFNQYSSNPNLIYDRLKKSMAKSTKTDGILEKEIPRQGFTRKDNETDTIICLSPEGREYYIERETDEFYQKVRSSKHRYFNSVQYSKVVWPYLTTQKLNMMYQRAGIRIYTYEKPSLNFMTYYLFDNHCYQRELTIKNNYLDSSLSQVTSRDSKIEELTKILNEGIFYTKEEVRDFINSVTDSGADSFKAVKWHGLFISDKNMFVNFVLGYGKNDVVFSSDAEIKNMLSIFNKYLVPMTHVQRNIPHLNDEIKSYKNEIDAIVIGASSSHTYAEVIGKKFGHVKSSDKVKKRSYYKRPSTVDLLNYNSKNFKKIYSLDDRKTGIDMLSYITHTTLEDYHDYGLALFGEDERFKLSISNFYPAVYKLDNITSFYLPVYEVKTLRKISDDYGNNKSAIMIACNKEMFETVAHSLRLQGHYSDNGEYLPGLFFVEIVSEIDSDGMINEHLGEVYDEKSGAYSIYDKNGYIFGRKIFDQFLKENGKMVKTLGQYTNAAKASRRSDVIQSDLITTTKFLNNLVSIQNKYDVDTGKSILDRYLKTQLTNYLKRDDVKLEPYQDKKPKTRKVRYSKQMQLMLTPELKKRITTTAAKKGITPGFLVREAITLLLDSVDKIYSVYDVDETGAYDEAVEILKKVINEKTNELTEPQTSTIY